MTDEAINNSGSVSPVSFEGAASLLALAVAVLLGDRLLWVHSPEISFALFLAGLGAIHVIWHRKRIEKAALLAGGLVLTMALLPLVEVMNPLSFIIGTTGTLLACLIFQRGLPRGWPRQIDVLVSSCLSAPFRFPAFAWSLTSSAGKARLFSGLAGWIVPLLFAGIFVALFAQANPVWEQWLAAIDLDVLLALIFSGRVLFWVAIAWFAWPFVGRSAPVRGFVRISRHYLRITFPTNATRAPVANIAFFERCLILFNLVFAAQTLLDLTYLWGGAVLPAGMTYAGYAHRGAYPLVAAALLAALFVVVAMRPGGPGEISEKVKWLVLAWVAQNLLLVGSSLFRLNLYIEVYALTYWRVAAFIWMMLVAVGLALIVFRFMTGRSSGWLVSANVLVLVATLYTTSLINLPGVIASYNLQHSNLVTDNGPEMDFHYLRRLGPGAYPAVAQFQREQISHRNNPALARLEKRLGQTVERIGSHDWRSWSFRNQRSYWVWRAQQIRSAEMSDQKPGNVGP